MNSVKLKNASWKEDLFLDNSWGCNFTGDHTITTLINGSAVVEDRFLCWHVGSKFIPTATIATKQWSGNKCSDVLTKIQLRVTRWFIRTGRVNNGGLSVKHAAALAYLTARFSQTVEPFWRLILYIFLMYLFFLRFVHNNVNETESLSTCHIFSKLLLCCQFCWQSTCRQQH